MTTKLQSVLIVGNFLSSLNGTSGICEVLSRKLSQNGWMVTTTSTQNNRLLRIADMFNRTLQSRNKYRVAIIDVFSGPSFIWVEGVSWLLNRLNKPFVLILRGGKLPAFAKRWPRRVKLVLERANYVMSPSHYIAAELSWLCSDIHVLPNALDLSVYQFELRTQPKPKLAWLRAFHAIYDPELAVKTVAILVTEFPEIELAMYGPDKSDGSHKAVQEYIETTQIATSISILGAIPKTIVPSSLAQHDIFLNTTTAESFGVAVMEAAALGMCIVTTNVGELPYIWTHDHDALLVPPNDPQAMAAAVRRILTEPGLSEHLSRNARTKAEQFDWSAILPHWQALLTDVIELHGSNPR